MTDLCNEVRLPTALSIHICYHAIFMVGSYGVHRYKPIYFLYGIAAIDTPMFKVPNPAVAMDAWAGPACYPWSNFYPLSFRGV